MPTLQYFCSLRRPSDEGVGSGVVIGISETAVSQVHDAFLAALANLRTRDASLYGEIMAEFDFPDASIKATAEAAQITVLEHRSEHPEWLVWSRTDLLCALCEYTLSVYEVRGAQLVPLHHTLGFDDLEELWALGRLG